MSGKVCGQGQRVRARVGGMWWGSGVSLSNVGAVQMLLSCLLFPHPEPASHLFLCSCRGVAGQDCEPRYR